MNEVFYQLWCFNSLKQARGFGVICTFWSSGFYQNEATNPTAWATHWGDGLRAGLEKWDDGNTSNGDGWSSDCTSVESNYVWSGGSVNSKDTCTLCTTGFYQNDPSNPTLWIPHWGDGIKAGGEKWDDQNNTGGDGWSSDCATIETGWVWSGGSLTAKDIWIYWADGLYQNDAANPTLWVPHWGDGRKAGNEKWDDANTMSGDGWSSNWLSVETNYVWSGGTSNSKDTWSLWSYGFYQNDPLNPTTCITHWGDGKRAGNEKWDDANTIDGDGWKGDWSSVEQNWVWSGGNPNSIDTCTQCLHGLYQNDNLASTICVPHWGDGFKAGDEKWDDGNTDDNDGCKGDWSKVEDQWICSGGSLYAKDIWSFWTSGFYQNDHFNPTSCITRCGDEKRVGDEKCDDGNEVNGDGWSRDCKIIEENYIWLGGSSNSKDICTLCSPGTYLNKEHNFWLPSWGDGLRAGNEKWDDGNTKSGDGCSEDCTFIEPSWVWSGGTPTSKDNWTYWASGWYQNNPANPEFWVSKWGDGFRVGFEIWDNLNNKNDEGWNSCSEIKEFYIWNGGNDTTADKWKAWSQFFEPNKDKSEWIIKPAINLIVTIFVFIAIAWISAFALFTFIMNPRARFIDIEYIQKVVLLPLVNVKLIPSFTNFFYYMSYSLLGFQFTGLSNIILICTGDEQENRMLSLLNFFSTSTLSNTIIYFVFGFLIVVVFGIIRTIILYLFLWNRCVLLAKYANDKLNVIFFSRILVGYLFFGWLLTCISSISEITHVINKQLSWSLLFPALILLFWISLIFFLICMSLFIKDDQNILVKIDLITFKQKDSSQSDLNKGSNKEIELIDMHKDNKNYIIEEDKEDMNNKINQTVINTNNQESSREIFLEVPQGEGDNEHIDIAELHDGGEENSSHEDSQASDPENHKEEGSKNHREWTYNYTFGDYNEEIRQKSNEEIRQKSNEENAGHNNEISDEINNEDIAVDKNDGINKKIDENNQNNGQIANQNKKEIEGLREGDNLNKGDASFYTAALLIHQILIVLCLIVISSNPIIKIIAFIIIQIIYIVWLRRSRPFINNFENKHKFFNEMYIILYLCIMLLLHFWDEEVTIIL